MYSGVERDIFKIPTNVDKETSYLPCRGRYLVGTPVISRMFVSSGNHFLGDLITDLINEESEDD